MRKHGLAYSVTYVLSSFKSWVKELCIIQHSTWSLTSSLSFILFVILKLVNITLIQNPVLASQGSQYPCIRYQKSYEGLSSTPKKCSIARHSEMCSSIHSSYCSTWRKKKQKLVFQIINWHQRSQRYLLKDHGSQFRIQCLSFQKLLCYKFYGNGLPLTFVVIV